MFCISDTMTAPSGFRGGKLKSATLRSPVSTFNPPLARCDEANCHRLYGGNNPAPFHHLTRRLTVDRLTHSPQQPPPAAVGTQRHRGLPANPGQLEERSQVNHARFVGREEDLGPG